MDDCISRKAAIDICNDELLHTEEYSPIRTWNRILQLPSAQPEPHWIPCSERLPENDDIVLITMDDSITVRGVFIEQLSNELGFFKDGSWHWAYESGQDYWPETTHVTAWMPLPESYKP